MLAVLYPWIKALHVISVVAWMAGLFYLPRLFVYHAEKVGQDGQTHALFLTMEDKLLRIIMRPAMIASWAFGLILAVTPGVIDWSAVWPWTKLAAILAMTWFHVWCLGRFREFEAAASTISGRRFRLMNEVPTLLLVVIVVSVIVRPL